MVDKKNHNRIIMLHTYSCLVSRNKRVQVISLVERTHIASRMALESLTQDANQQSSLSLFRIRRHKERHLAIRFVYYLVSASCSHFLWPSLSR